MTNHPEQLDTDHMALVSPVVQDILAASYADQLEHGKPEYEDGLDEEWKAAAQSALERYKLLIEQDTRTHADLLICQVFLCASAPDLDSLYRRVIHLAGYAVDWAEHLAERGHGGESE